MALKMTCTQTLSLILGIHLLNVPCGEAHLEFFLFALALSMLLSLGIKALRVIDQGKLRVFRDIFF